MKQRLNIAQAIFEKQDIILLDEPTNALDEDGINLIYNIIRDEKQRGATIIVATHHKEDLKELCNIILKISSGKIVEETKLNETIQKNLQNNFNNICFAIYYSRSCFFCIKSEPRTN